MIPEPVGVFWATQVGSTVLAVLSVWIVIDASVKRAAFDATRTHATILLWAQDNSVERFRFLADKEREAQRDWETRCRIGEWGSYASAIFAAPGLAEIAGKVRFYYEAGFLDWASIDSTDTVLTFAVATYLLVRSIDIGVYRVRRPKMFRLAMSEFNEA